MFRERITDRHTWSPITNFSRGQTKQQNNDIALQNTVQATQFCFLMTTVLHQAQPKAYVLTQNKQLLSKDASGGTGLYDRMCAAVPHNECLHQEVHFILFGTDFWKSLWSRRIRKLRVNVWHC